MAGETDPEEEEDDQEQRNKIMKQLAFPEIEKDTPSSHCNKVSSALQKRIKKLAEGVKQLSGPAASAEQTELHCWELKHCASSC